MMRILRIPMSLALLLFATACVTINVYFPAQAAEEAADLIIRDVYGEGAAPAPEPAEPQSFLSPQGASVQQGNLVLDWLIPPAHAAADLSVNTPAIRQLKASMESRHQKLAPFYNSGAVGISNNGEVKIRDQKLVPLKDRNNLKGIISKENRDRNALYKEIAKANSHPEWEADIRKTFARRWVDNAGSGWWYQDQGGSWRQK